jgi:hypothetical protein
LVSLARATSTRCANFPHHGSRRCTCSGLVADAMIALLILPICAVKFLAFGAVKFSRRGSSANPGRQREQRLRREPHRSTVQRKRLWARAPVRPRQRQIASAPVGKLGPDPVPKRPQDDDLSTAPGMDAQGDPEGLVRLPA